MLLHEVVDHSQFVTLEYNEYEELVETVLPENIRVYTEIDEKDLQEGMHNTYSVAC